MESTNDTSQTAAGGRGAWGLACALALAALAVSVYLAATSWAGGGPAGCGDGSGCGAVLASKWSKVGPVPVGAFAALVYAGVLALLGMQLRPRQTPSAPAVFATGVAIGLIVAAAGWFVFVQLALLNAVCPYCMAGHALGVALALTLGFAVARRGAGALAVGVVVGFLGVAGVAAWQHVADAPVHRLVVPTDGDYDVRDDQRRAVGLLGGELRLAFDEEPVWGKVDADQVVVLMYDHACPHCQHTHHVLRKVKDAQGDSLAVVLMPVPLNHACNGFANEDLPERFDESCERTRIALAVFLAEPAAFLDFDTWMFDAETYRTAEAARTKAEQLVGADALREHLADPRVEAMLARNVEAFGSAGGQRVPVTLAPWADAIDGRIEDAAAFDALLSQSREGRPANAE